ncbi:MAG: MBL fold metallo-hydrolase [Haloarculaceae archaeon]
MTRRDITRREIAEGLHLLQGCVVPEEVQARLDEMDEPPPWYDPTGEVHAQFNAYLFAGEETLLFDTLPPNMRGDVLDALDAVLDGRDLDYLVVSHPEAPHGGNAGAILEAYPGTELLVPETDELHDLALGSAVEEHADVTDGDELDLGSHAVEFCRSPMFDLAATTWMYERETGALFTVDAYGNAHAAAAGECGRFVDELTDDPEAFTTQRWLGFHSHTFPWFAYVEPGRLAAEIEALVDRFEPDLVAPAHGAPIRADAVGYLRRLVPVIEQISDLGLGQDIRVTELA